MKYFKISSLLFCTLAFSTNCNAHTGVEQIEKKHGVKIGVYAIDTNNGNILSHRQDEKFPFQSTVKMIVAAAALKNIDSGEKIKISSDDVVFWSPIVRLNLDRGYMTTEKLAEAAMSYSDNAATNILIKKLGGIGKINEFAKTISNTSFNLGNIEPKLNSNPRNIHDTSTPKDMAQSTQKLLLDSNALSNEKQQKLKDWMINNTTGYTKIRAGLPAGWHAAEKTGGGNSDVSNDIGIVWSPACKPIVLAIYTISNEKNNKKQAESIKVTTKLILSEFSKNNTCFAATDFK